MSQTPSAMLVEQRIRNRLIESLQLITTTNSEDPDCNLNELINHWYDWVPDDWTLSEFPCPPYTTKEVACLQAVHELMTRFCEMSPRDIIHAATEMLRPEWINLRHAAQIALLEMQIRGQLSEGVEADN